jgi:hypothetical protein
MTTETKEEKQFTETEVMDLIKKTREMEQWRIAGDTGYGLAINHLQTMAQQGAVDPYVVQVMQALRQAFRQANAIGQPAPAQPAAPEKEPEE